MEQWVRNHWPRTKDERGPLADGNRERERERNGSRGSGRERETLRSRGVTGTEGRDQKEVDMCVKGMKRMESDGILVISVFTIFC